MSPTTPPLPLTPRPLPFAPDVLPLKSQTPHAGHLLLFTPPTDLPPPSLLSLPARTMTFPPHPPPQSRGLVLGPGALTLATTHIHAPDRPHPLKSLPASVRIHPTPVPARVQLTGHTNSPPLTSKQRSPS